MFGQTNGCTHEARKLYEEAFQNSEISSMPTLYRRLRDNGNFAPKRSDCGRARTTRPSTAKERVWEQIAANRGISTRKVTLLESIPKCLRNST